MIYDIEALEKQMLDLRQSLTDTSADFDKIFKDTFDVTTKFGTRSQDALAALNVYSRAGKSPEELASLLPLTAMARNVGDIPERTFATGAVAFMKTYNEDIDGVRDMLDALTALQDKHKLSMEQSLSVMEKTGSAAKILGMDYKELLSVLTAVSQVSGEEPEQAAASLNYLLGRIHKGKSIQSFESIGVAVMKALPKRAVHGTFSKIPQRSGIL